MQDNPFWSTNSLIGNFGAFDDKYYNCKEYSLILEDPKVLDNKITKFMLHSTGKCNKNHSNTDKVLPMLNPIT